MRCIKSIILLILFAFSFSACESDLIDMDAINNEVNTKLKRKIAIKIKDCRQKALEDAEVYVDSIIANITHDFIKKDIDFPEKPQRDTEIINYQIKVDSVNIKRLTDSLNLIADSLNIK